LFLFLLFAVLQAKPWRRIKKAEIAYVKWAEAIATAHLAEAV
jgi:hypothetical protein